MDRYKATNRIALIGMLANIFLLAVKLTAGFSGKSQAMIADGFNSAGDIFASAMTFAGNRIASKPGDDDHPYGHGKAEYIFSMIISFSLLAVAYKIFKSSLDSITSQARMSFSWLLAVAAAITIALKSFLFLYTRSAGKKYGSLLLIANSEDHRNDVFVTSSTLLGIYLGLSGLPWADGAVGMGISLWIAYTGSKIFSSAYNVLMDTNIDRSFKEKMTAAVLSVDGVDHIDDIRAKPVGAGFIVIVKVSVEGSMTVFEGHGIAAEIKERLRGFKPVKDVVVHVNPD